MADLAAAMAQLTAARTAQLVDTCTITRDGTTVYDGPCVLARHRSTDGRPATSPTTNDQAGVPEPRTLKLPGAADPRPGDLVVMTDCPFSPSLVSHRFLVLHEDPRTYATFRSFTVRGSSWRSPAAGA